MRRGTTPSRLDCGHDPRVGHGGSRTSQPHVEVPCRRVVIADRLSRSWPRAGAGACAGRRPGRRGARTSSQLDQRCDGAGRRGSMPSLPLRRVRAVEGAGRPSSTPSRSALRAAGVWHHTARVRACGFPGARAEGTNGRRAGQRPADRAGAGAEHRPDLSHHHPRRRSSPRRWRTTSAPKSSKHTSSAPAGTAQSCRRVRRACGATCWGSPTR